MDGRSGARVRLDVARALAGGVVVGAALCGACTVGSGTGAATGNIWMLGCDNTHDLGSPTAPIAYSLQPSFFAGEPIEDSSQGAHQNRLVIRMQRDGSAIETTDTLFFDVEDSYEVARCVRGRTVNGQPDWNTDYRGTGAWCDWTGTAFGGGDGASGAEGGVSADAGDAGGASDAGAVDAAAGAGNVDGSAVVESAPHATIHLTTNGVLRSHLSLLGSCPLARLVGDSKDGAIEFIDFGDAAQPDLPPEMRGAVSPDFKVDYGGRLRANFRMVLEDDRVVTAPILNQPVPDPRFGGDLGGSFDFDLDRGRAAQPFP
jgi:hypothetical protein